jgi:hypothetical protein
MTNETEMINQVRRMSDTEVLEEYSVARDKVCSPGYGDFPDEAIEQALQITRHEILRRMNGRLDR